MKLMILAAALTAALAIAAGPASATSDPGAAVRQDVIQLANDLRSAHAVLVPDVQTLKTDLARHDKSSVKTDVQKLRTDAKAALTPVQKDRHQLIADMKAAKAAGLTIPDALKGGGTANQTALKGVLALAHQARAALKSLHATAASHHTHKK